jgi:HemY protein
LFELPRQAKRWRLQQKERAAHGALLDAMAQFMDAGHKNRKGTK